MKNKKDKKKYCGQDGQYISQQERIKTARQKIAGNSIAQIVHINHDKAIKSAENKSNKNRDKGKKSR